MFMAPIATAMEPPPWRTAVTRRDAEPTGRTLGEGVRPGGTTTPRLAAVKTATALVRSLRPRQWVKNVLVVAAPLAAGDVGKPGVLGATAIAFLSFCLASSAVYLVNDCVDREADRAHPRKRFRPIAAGELSVPLALGAAVVLAAAAAALALATTWQLLVLVLA